MVTLNQVTPEVAPQLRKPQQLLDVRGITKCFGGITALENVSLQLGAGEVLGLLGANGSGKTTLSRIVAAEIRPNAGQILVGGEPLARASPKEAKRRRIAIAHQHPSLPPHFPVWESIFFGAELTYTGGILRRARERERAARLLERLGANVGVDAYCGDLTAAGQQWVEIARAVSLDPRILILDEPTAALTAPEVEMLFSAVARLTVNSVGVIFISHRLQEVEQICNRVTVLRNGKNVSDWSTSGKVDVQSILDLMVGDHDPGGIHSSAKARRPGDPILRVTGLTSGAEVQNVDLTLHEGEILGVAGLQGQGQEELLEVIAGFRPSSGGRIVYKGDEVAPKLPRDMIDRGICLVPNDRYRQGLFMDSDVGANLAYVAVALNRRPWMPPPRSLSEFAQSTIERLMIKTSGPSQGVSTLSGGNQQKVLIGKWLSIPMHVLLLSDPTKGVDVHARKEIYALVQELVADGRAAIVYASDVMELMEFCDRIIVMCEGRVTANLSGDAITEHRITSASFAGTDRMEA